MFNNHGKYSKRETKKTKFGTVMFSQLGKYSKETISYHTSNSVYPKGLAVVDSAHSQRSTALQNEFRILRASQSNKANSQIISH